MLIALEVDRVQMMNPQVYTTARSIVVFLAFAAATIAQADILHSPKVAGLPALKVDTVVLKHAVEKRGFVEVPLDYTDPHSPKISIFYRWIPSSRNSSNSKSKTAPTLVFMNGGPGSDSSYLRTLDYDYSAHPSDSISNLLTVFNIVLVDQRGTGNSFPLDQLDGSVELKMIARYLNADALALDHAQVINTLLTLGYTAPDQLYVMAHSFGVSIAWSYIRELAKGRVSPVPKGLILSAGGVPIAHAEFDLWLGGRAAQRAFNIGARQYSLDKGLEPFDHLVMRARRHFQDLGFDRSFADFGSGDMYGGTSADMYKTVSSLFQFNTREKVIGMLHDPEWSDTFNLISTVLDVQSCNDNRSNQDLIVAASHRYPLPDWMEDPLKPLLIQESYNPNRQKELYRLLKDGGIPSIVLPTAEQTKSVMSKTKILIHYARGDVTTGWGSAVSYMNQYLGKDLAKKTIVLTDGPHEVLRTSSEGAHLIRTYFGL